MLIGTYSKLLELIFNLSKHVGTYVGSKLNVSGPHQYLFALIGKQQLI